MAIWFPHLRARANDHVTLLDRMNPISVSPLLAYSLSQSRIWASLKVCAADSECMSTCALSEKRFTSIKARGQSVPLSVARKRKSVSILCPGIDGCRQSLMFPVSGTAATAMKKTRRTASASVYLLRNVSTFPATVCSSAERGTVPSPCVPEAGGIGLEIILGTLLHVRRSGKCSGLECLWLQLKQYICIQQDMTMYLQAHEMHSGHVCCYYSVSLLCCCIVIT